MKQRIFTDPIKAAEYLTQEQSNGLNALAYLTPSGEYVVLSIAKQYYINEDGDKVEDMVWLTEDYKLVYVNDMTDTEAKNIVREIIRSEIKMQTDLIDQVIGSMEDGVATMPIVIPAGLPDDMEGGEKMGEQSFIVDGPTTLQ